MVHDLAFADESLKTAADTLADDGQARPALDLIAGAADVHRREHAVSVLGAAGAGRLEELRELTRQRAYHGERWLLLGAALAAAAWEARGSGRRARTRDREVDRRIQRQQQLVAEARGALRQAAALGRDDAVPWSELTGVVLAAPQHPSEPDDVFRRAVVLGNDLYRAHTRHLVTLSGKWYGNQDKVLAFARLRAQDRPDGHPLHALIALAHLEGYVEGVLHGNLVGRFWRAWRYFADGAIRREVDAAADRLLAGADEYAQHPWTMSAHQAFAALYHQAGDAHRARTHLELSGDRAAVWPWRYFGDHEKQFASARRAVGLTP
ncbi:hypothetical protein [Dactylosporangium sp. CA-092794]|uniref:hypothetical protein n=1 Tax=Dactylosporangium sp. CA-092794 TaxID=3239929 RepID=UPI003D923397